MSARASLRAAAAAALLAISPAGCGGEQASSSAAADEPIRVELGQFVAGALPGEPPPSADASASGDASTGPSPAVSDLSTANRVIQSGQEGKVLSGHATTDARTVAVRFADLGTGYWIVPVGSPDPSDNGLLTWTMAADFGADVPAGLHSLRFAAIGADGTGGAQFDLPVCVDTVVPDNLNACDRRRGPPAAVVSLSWDTPVDLDVIVRVPSGATVGGKTDTTAPPAGADGGAAGTDPTQGVLDHDSNRNCAIDGIDREDVVWQKAPTPGTYEVWVDLFRSCGQKDVHFAVSVWTAHTEADGTQRLVETPLGRGLLLASQATGGTAPGLFVGNFVLR